MYQTLLCDDYSGTFAILMSLYFLLFFTDQDVPPATKGYVTEPNCLTPVFAVYFVNSGEVQVRQMQELE